MRNEKKNFNVFSMLKIQWFYFNESPNWKSVTVSFCTAPKFPVFLLVHLVSIAISLEGLMPTAVKWINY